VLLNIILNRPTDLFNNFPIHKVCLFLTIKSTGLSPASPEAFYKSRSCTSDFDHTDVWNSLTLPVLQRGL